jgi:uncharacterized protein YhbP (UPF0306 family)
MRKERKVIHRTDTATTVAQNADVNKFVREYHARLPMITHVQAKAKLDYASGKEKLNANLIIRSRYDSVLWISVVPLLGIEAARIKITRDSFYIMDKINHTITVSTIQKAEEKLGVKISLKEIQELMLGLTHIPDKTNKYKQDKIHLITATANKIDYAFEIQKELTLYSLFLKGQQSGYTSHIHYLNYTDIPFQNNTIKLPFYLTAELHTKEHIQAELTYTKINLNTEKFSTPFDFSKNYKIIYE